jgi:carbonic anhydrase
MLQLGAGALLTAACGAANAASSKAPPKSGNVMSPDAALTTLMQGNARYVDGLTRRSADKCHQGPRQF